MFIIKCNWKCFSVNISESLHIILEASTRREIFILIANLEHRKRSMHSEKRRTNQINPRGLYQCAITALVWLIEETTENFKRRLAQKRTANLANRSRERYRSNSNSYIKYWDYRGHIWFMRFLKSSPEDTTETGTVNKRLSTVTVWLRLKLVLSNNAEACFFMKFVVQGHVKAAPWVTMFIQDRHNWMRGIGPFEYWNRDCSNLRNRSFWKNDCTPCLYSLHWTIPLHASNRDY